MKKTLFVAFLALLASCSGPTPSELAARAVNEYLKNVAPKSGPYEVVAVTRLDSACNPAGEVERVRSFYAEAQKRLDVYLEDMHGDDPLTRKVAKLAALEYIADLDYVAPLDWVLDAGKQSFEREPKDCMAARCSFRRLGRSLDSAVFYLDNSGRSVIYSDGELLNSWSEILDAERYLQATIDLIR